MKRLLPLMLLLGCTKPSTPPAVIPPATPPTDTTTIPVTADTALNVGWQTIDSTMLVTVTGNSGAVIRFATVTLEPASPLKDNIVLGTTDASGNVSAVVTSLKGYDLCASYKNLKSCTGLN
jgi:hypothetical protein